MHPCCKRANKKIKCTSCGAAFYCAQVAIFAQSTSNLLFFTNNNKKAFYIFLLLNLSKSTAKFFIVFKCFLETPYSVWRASNGLLTFLSSVIDSAHGWGADKEALLRLRGHEGKRSTVVIGSPGCDKAVSGERSLVFTLLAFVRGNAEAEKSRAGEGSLCLWRGWRSSDIPPTADEDSLVQTWRHE